METVPLADVCGVPNEAKDTSLIHVPASHSIAKDPPSGTTCSVPPSATPVSGTRLRPPLPRPLPRPARLPVRFPPLRFPQRLHPLEGAVASLAVAAADVGSMDAENGRVTATSRRAHSDIVVVLRKDHLIEGSSYPPQSACTPACPKYVSRLCQLARR